MEERALNTGRSCWKVIALMLCLFAGNTFAIEQEPFHRVQLGDSFPIEVAPSVRYFEDTSGEMGLEDARDHLYEHLPQDQIRFGYSRSKFWLRFGVANHSVEPKELILRTFVRFMRPIEIFQRTNEGAFSRVLYNDQDSAFGSRPEGMRHLGHQFEIPASGTVDFYIHFGAGGTASLPLVVTDGRQIREEQYEATIKIVIFLAIIGTLVLSNLFYFVAIRAWAYLLYVLQEIAFVFYVSHMDGYTFQYIWPDYPELNANATPVLGGLCHLFAAWFSITFLRSREYTPRYHHFLVALTIALGIYVFASIFLESRITNQIGLMLPFILTATLLPLAVYVVYKGHLAARYYLLGWIFVYALLGYYSSFMLGLADTSFAPMDIVRMALIIEAIALSLGLADRYRRLNDENRRNQAELVDQLQIRLEEARERVQLEQDKESALRQVFDKSKVLASASHDIAQPIRSLRLALDSTIKEIRNPEVLASITSTLDDMEAVIGDALEDASGAMKEASDEVVAGIDKILNDVVANYQNEVLDKGLYVRVFAPVLTASISVVSLKRCLANLVSNAIHYTPEGGILVAARKRGKGILIQVFDTGIGLSESNQENLLGYHQKGDSSTGYGLGLAIVSEISNASGWEFTVRSEQNKGSCFSIFMPDCLK